MPAKLADYGLDEDTSKTAGSVDWKETFKQHDDAPASNQGTNEIESFASNQIDDENSAGDLDLSKVPVKFLELSILTKTKCDEVDALRRAKADRYLVRSENEKLLEIKKQYYETVGKKFPVSADRTAFEFVYNYYDYIDNERNISSMLQYYQKDSVLNINGYAKFIGSANIMKAILANFCDLSVDHTIQSVSLDRNPPRRCVMFIKAYGTIRLQEDRPRQFMEIFELKYSNKNAFGASKYYISNQIFTITDSRPLYAWPAKDIPVTNYDNTEPKPEPVVEVVEEVDKGGSAPVMASVTKVVSGISNWMSSSVRGVGGMFATSMRMVGGSPSKPHRDETEEGEEEEVEVEKKKKKKKKFDPESRKGAKSKPPMSFLERLFAALSSISPTKRPVPVPVRKKPRVNNRVHVSTRLAQ